MLSIDPSSPFTQGALLGDRIRLTEHFLDQGVFIRSMANRGALGGLSEAALQAALLLDAAGRQDVFVETVGVGQAEIDIIDHADTIVLVLMPGSGDSIQALKAGVMEIPDVIVINKADHPLTDTMVREIRGVLSLANLDRTPEEVKASWRVPIVKTEATRGAGIDELVRAPRRAPRAHRRGRHARRAPPAQPAQRGAGDRDRAHAPPPGGGPRRGRASSSCSTRSSSGGWTRPARPARCFTTRRRRSSTRAESPRRPQPTRADCPPSTGSSTPVMKRASSEARNRAALATSQAVPMPPFSGTASSRRAA